MATTKIYDLPTRLFHWTFAGLFLAAFVIAKTVDDESVIFSYHMLFGMTLAVAVLYRIVWGFIGSKHARFSHFNLAPSQLITYFRDLFTDKTKLYPGHNPASSWAAIVMMLLALGMAFTGFQMATGNKEAFEDIHEILAYAFLLTAVGHVFGIIIHTIRHRELIGLSMISGDKPTAAPAEAISGSRAFAGIVFIIVVFAFGTTVFKNFNTEKRTLDFGGTTLQLGKDQGNDTGEDSEEE